MDKQEFKILIVDDNPHNLVTLRALLSRIDGCQIYEASSGEEALALTVEQQHHLILLDVQMPEMDGYETAYHLQMTERTQDIPIVFVTAVFKSKEFIRRGYAVGAVDYLTKPIDENMLLNRVRQYMRLNMRGQQLKRSEERLNLALDASCEGLWDWNVEENSVYFSTRWGELMEYEEQSSPPTLDVYLRRVHAEDLERVQADLNAVLEGGKAHFYQEHRLRAKGGGWLWVLAQGKVVQRDFAGKAVRMVGTHSDISERKIADEHLRQSAEVLLKMPDGVMILDRELRFVSINAAFTESTGYTLDEVIGRKAEILNSGRHNEVFFIEMRETLAETGGWRGEIWNRRKSGEVYPEWLNISILRDEQEEVAHYVCIFSDLSSQEHVRNRLQYLAYHDVLTDLPNRELFKDRLANTIANAKRDGHMVALLFMDLDRFKTINDTLGHSLGDLLLQAVANRIKELLRSNDTMARLGGDEFTFILPGVDAHQYVAVVASKIIEAMHQPFKLGEQLLHVTASIGIGIYPENGNDPETLLKNADVAMYRAKDNGRDRYQFYSQEMTSTTEEHFRLEADLRNAITNDEFILHYQPLVVLGSGELIGAEALIRWEHPELGMVLPEKFISVAEESGLIMLITAWVMEEACCQSQAWLEDGLNISRVSVNISGCDIDRGDLLGITKRVLDKTGLDPLRLELEVSEGFIMTRIEQAIGTLNSLRDMGVHLAIDDFGTGYSSLSYLKRLPISRLKIDRSFVCGLPDDSDDAAITRAVIALGKSLGLSVLAEGIEEEVQQEFLMAAGCDEGQGNLYSRPVAADEFYKLFKK